MSNLDRIPSSFCPFTNEKCKRMYCALWVETKSYHGCAFFFIAVKAAKEIEKDE